MQLSQFTDYALRVLMYAAVHPERDCQIAEIATRYAISRNHLVKVVNHLSRAGFLKTKRGRGGGIHLGRTAEAIRVGDVVRSTESTPNLLDCFDPANKVCCQTAICRLKGVFREAHLSFFKTLDQYTLEHLIENSAELRAMYDALPSKA